MGMPIIFSGNDAKTLKSNIDLNGNSKVMSGTVDPSSTATSANKGSLYLNTSNGNVYRKTDNGSSTNWTALSSGGGGSAGDITETSFSISESASNATVTGFLFGAGVRSFEALVSVFIDATSDLAESFKIHGVQKSGSWEINYTAVGDNTNITFVISSGQILYSSSTYSGFVSGTMTFRAITTTA